MLSSHEFPSCECWILMNEIPLWKFLDGLENSCLPGLENSCLPGLASAFTPHARRKRRLLCRVRAGFFDRNFLHEESGTLRYRHELQIGW